MKVTAPSYDGAPAISARKKEQDMAMIAISFCDLVKLAVFMVSTVGSKMVEI